MTEAAEKSERWPRVRRAWLSENSHLIGWVVLTMAALLVYIVLHLCLAPKYSRQASAAITSSVRLYQIWEYPKTTELELYAGGQALLDTEFEAGPLGIGKMASVGGLVSAGKSQLDIYNSKIGSLVHGTFAQFSFVDSSSSVLTASLSDLLADDEEDGCTGCYLQIDIGNRSNAVNLPTGQEGLRTLRRWIEGGMVFDGSARKPASAALHSFLDHKNCAPRCEPPHAEQWRHHERRAGAERKRSAKKRLKQRDCTPRDQIQKGDPVDPACESLQLGRVNELNWEDLPEVQAPAHETACAHSDTEPMGGSFELDCYDPTWTRTQIEKAKRRILDSVRDTTPMLGIPRRPELKPGVTAAFDEKIMDAAQPAFEFFSGDSTRQEQIRDASSVLQHALVERERTACDDHCLAPPHCSDSTARQECNATIEASAECQRCLPRFHYELIRITKDELGFFWVFGLWRWVEVVMLTWLGVLAETCTRFGIQYARRDPTGAIPNPREAGRTLLKLGYAPAVSLVVVHLLFFTDLTENDTALAAMSATYWVPIAFMLGLFPNLGFDLLRRVAEGLLGKTSPAGPPKPGRGRIRRESRTQPVPKGARPDFNAVRATIRNHVSAVLRD